MSNMYFNNTYFCNKRSILKLLYKNEINFFAYALIFLYSDIKLFFIKIAESQAYFTISNFV